MENLNDKNEKLQTFGKNENNFFFNQSNRNNREAIINPN